MKLDIEEKKKKLQQEIKDLREEFEVKLPRQIEEARSHGDLRENSEYHSALERQAYVQARIGQLNNQLGQLSSLAADLDDSPNIGFGSRVLVHELNSDTRTEITVIQPNETDPPPGSVSIISPVGRALRDRTVGETVTVVVPAGEKRFYIEQVTTPLGTVYKA